MFFVSFHSSGGLAVRETPVAYGPRHCAQKRSCGLDCAEGSATVTIAKNENDSDATVADL
jgi:hypothetical protein